MEDFEIKLINYENNEPKLGEGSLTFEIFRDVVFKGRKITLSEECKKKISGCETFVDHLVENNIKVYGLTTGFADLRNTAVEPTKSGFLSHNIIVSHDAGIGPSLSKEIVKGAMLIRVYSLAQGRSGFTLKHLNLLISMINKDIIPIVPENGSLGASGDLAYLARLGCCMEGSSIHKVLYKGKQISAKEALEIEKLEPMKPKAKEGLALTNGTSFMASMAAIAYIFLKDSVKKAIDYFSLFARAFKIVDSAFLDPIHNVRLQNGQKKVAKKIHEQVIKECSFIDHNGIQDDYCIRCIPQIFGYFFEMMDYHEKIILKEMNAITDNPLIFKGNEISSNVPKSRIHEINGEKWAVLSGGNFHGGYMASTADTLSTQLVKIALTLERQMTLILNPARNGKRFPIYLINKGKDVGLKSGFIIVQYTACSLAQQIQRGGNPVGIYNITSGNESEDIVSFGASAMLNLHKQIELFRQLLVCYLITVAQGYSINCEGNETDLDKSDKGETQQLFLKVKSILSSISHELPLNEDCSFADIYEELTKFVEKNEFLE